MSEKLTGGLKGNFSRFLPDSGLVLEGGNISGPNLLDLQVNGTSKLNIDKNSKISGPGVGLFSTGPSLTNFNGMFGIAIDNQPNSSKGIQFYTGGAHIGQAQFSFWSSSGFNGGFFSLHQQGAIGWSSNAYSNNGAPDLFLSRKAAANLRLGALDAAAPVAQTLSVQSVVAGTTDTAGVDLTITGSQGTGTGAGGSIIFQVAPAGTTANTQNALATALTINSNRSVTMTDLNVSSSALLGISPASIGFSSTGFVGVYFSGAKRAQIGSSSFTVNSGGNFSFSSDTNGTTGDTFLYRDAANTLALRNGVNAQQFNLYGSYTDVSNYGRLEIISGYFGVTGAAAIRTTSAGTETAGRLYLGVGGGNQWFFETNGNFLSNADNTYDIGASGASRPRNVYIAGGLFATTKSFVIDHPTKPNMKLRYGSLEGPENGVYVRGKSTSDIIELPEYWTNLVHEDSITVSLTAIGDSEIPRVSAVVNNKVYVKGRIGMLNYFYHIFAERKDVDKLLVEF